MNEKYQEWIQFLEYEWAIPDGFLGKIRSGFFDENHGDKFAKFVSNIDFSDKKTIDRRLVALLWYIPAFLQWQKERVAEQGGDCISYDRFINKIQEIIENVLGVP